MAAVSFTVSYTQNNDANNGTITFNGVIKPASGRLDKVGDFVFSDGFSAEGFDVTVECMRTSKKAMQIRIVFVSPPPFGFESCYVGCITVEKVLDKVKIDFDK